QPVAGVFGRVEPLGQHHALVKVRPQQVADRKGFAVAVDAGGQIHQVVGADAKQGQVAGVLFVDPQHAVAAVLGARVVEADVAVFAGDDDFKIRAVRGLFG